MPKIESPRLVADRKCTECLFSLQRLVPPERAAELIKKTITKKKFFVCHKGSLAGRDLVCHGSFQQYVSPDWQQLLLLMEKIRFVNPDRLEDLMSKFVVATIAPDGTVEISTEGTKGAECEELSRPFEESLGVATENKRTADYYREPERQKVRQ
jgi:hypothetical protein